MTAENVHPRPPPPAAGELASMRPRPMTAENGDEPRGAAPRERASMRPRPMTAENTSLPPSGSAQTVLQ